METDMQLREQKQWQTMRLIFLKAPKVVCSELSKMHKVVADNIICKGYNRRECNNSYEEIIYIICIAGGEEYK